MNETNCIEADEKVGMLERVNVLAYTRWTTFVIKYASYKVCRHIYSSSIYWI